MPTNPPEFQEAVRRYMRMALLVTMFLGVFGTKCSSSSHRGSIHQINFKARARIRKRQHAQ